MRRRPQDRFCDALGRVWRFSRNGWRQVKRTVFVTETHVYVNGKEVHGAEAEAVRKSFDSAFGHMDSAIKEMGKAIDAIGRDSER